LETDPAANTPTIVKGREMKYFATFLMIASLTVFGLGCAAEADKPAADPSPAAADDAGAEADAPAAPADAPADKEKEGSGL
jgi:hypothetical protein